MIIKANFGKFLMIVKYCGLIYQRCSAGKELLFFRADLHSVINTLTLFLTKHLYNPKVCLPLQPAKEVANLFSENRLKK